MLLHDACAPGFDAARLRRHAERHGQRVQLLEDVVGALRTAAGSLARQRMTSAERLRGTPGAASYSGTGSRVSCAAIVSRGDAPVNGDTPVNNS